MPFWISRLRYLCDSHFRPCFLPGPAGVRVDDGGVHDEGVSELHGLEVRVEGVADEDAPAVEEGEEPVLYVLESRGDGLEHGLGDARELRQVVDDGLLGLDELVENHGPVPGDDAYSRQRELGLARLAHLAVDGVDFASGRDAALLYLRLGNGAVGQRFDGCVDPAVPVLERLAAVAVGQHSGVEDEVVGQVLLRRGYKLCDPGADGFESARLGRGAGLLVILRPWEGDRQHGRYG